MRRLSILVLSLFVQTSIQAFLSSTALSANADFNGEYLQKTKRVVPALAADDCDANAKWEPKLSACISHEENTLEIKPLQSTAEPGNSNLFHVKGTNYGLGGNSCAYDFKMKQQGDKMVLAQGLDGASKNYSLVIKKTKNGIQVFETLGSNEEEANASPGCSVSSFIKGDGSGFIKKGLSAASN